MTEYFAFYDNMGKGIIVPVAFRSQKKADDFINDYEYYGEIRQFNYDHIGNNRKSFLEYLEEHGASGQGLQLRKQVVNYDGKVLFQYMMSMFGIRMR